MKYKITYENPTSQYIPIEASFNVESEDEIILQFPAWRPGRYELANFAKNIHGFTIKDEKSQKVSFQKISKDSWKVECSSVTELLVNYKYFSAELNAGSTFMDDLQLYVNPVNCLVYIADKQGESCELKLSLPDNFEIACGANHQNNIISTSSYHELVDSPFIASASLQHGEFESNGVKFHIWFQGDVKVDFKRIITDFEKYTNSQIEKFGEFPVTEYHYLFQILQIKAYHGVEHQASTVIALGPAENLFGDLYKDLLGVSSHELYHTWNIKAIRPVEMYPYDYSKENYSNLGYVAEGVTTYLGDWFLCNSGVKDFKWYRNKLEILLQRHFDNFGRFNYSVAESSWDTWLDGYVTGAPSRKVSIYNEGSLLTFVCDIKIRNGSNNKFSIHDIMKKLYLNFAKENKGYTEKDFIELINKYSEENQDDFFNNYYYGTHPFESILIEAFERIGLTLNMEKNTSQSQNILGIKFLETKEKTIVKQLYPGSSADIGKIMLEDEIIKINGNKVENNFDELVMSFENDQIELVVNRMGRTLELICPHTNKSYFPIYKIEKVKTTSNLSKRIFKKWAGIDWDTI